MIEDGDDLVARVHREAWEHHRQQPLPPPPEPRTIHYTELPPANPGDDLYLEWATYRREVGRLLAEGNAGRFVLIKEEQIIGVWDCEEDALSIAYNQFLLQPFLVHPIQERERLLQVRVPQRWPS